MSKGKRSSLCRALFIGRFQPFHKGHFAVIKNLISKYDEVLVVIGSANKLFSEENPFTASERTEMICECFTKKQLAKIKIVHLADIGDDSRWVAHVRTNVPEFQAIYSNNPLVRRLFSDAGIKVEKIDFFDRKNCEAKKLRSFMAKGKKEWRKHVPSDTVKYLDNINAEERIRKTRQRK